MKSMRSEEARVIRSEVKESNSVCIVGAGISGLACAERLAAQGIPSTIFEKSRGVGGRIATRQSEGVKFEYGAPVIHAREPRDWPWLTDNVNRGVLQPCAHGPASYWSAGPHGLRDTFAALSSKSFVCLEAAIERIEAVPDGVRLRSKDDAHYFCEEVVLTAPLPQSLALLPSASVEAPLSVEYARCIAVVLRMSQSSAEGLFEFGTGPLARVLVQNKSGQCFATLYSDHDFAVEHWERDMSTASDALTSSLVQVGPVGNATSAQKVHFHRWKYARALNPLQAAFWTDGRGVYIAGDAFLGGGFESAWRSGCAAAEAIVERRFLRKER
jgi:renalase